ncbi:CbbQ/NirQ/NorQ C-terminal domain-containing protein [Actinomadura sp. LOL_016]|uniref:CbbQ/NirQ/NorQ domain-containing protein n=1 Tax=unclassified Actinomadura TaxID=2626254 RepID=UPI003A80D365
MVAHEAGIDTETALALVRLGHAIRGLEGSPPGAGLGQLRDRRGAGTAPRRPGGRRPGPSDGPDVVRALGEPAGAVLPRA